ncbi:MAG: glycosyltransferase family 4 protein [Candidatus Hydrogenedentes bacterium]|nr:glycosyltransferase family 4 protein [Candidatus Hydrogenedentota bacterium]
MKPLNVLYLIRSWAFGGSHTILLTLMKHLPKDRYNIICVPYDTFSGLDEIFIEQARKRGLPPSEERIPWKSRGNWWKARAKVLELVGKYEIDLIHAHDPHSNTMIGIGRDFFPCATIASAYGWWDGFVPFRRFVYQWIERDFALKHFDRVITVSEHMKARIRKGPTPESIIRIIHTGIETTTAASKRSDFRAAHGIAEDAVVVGTVSRVSVEKGHTHLVNVMAKLRERCPTLCAMIVGQGPAKAELEEQVQRLGLDRTVKFTGFCDDLPTALSAMDIFAQPSVQQEGLPTAILEAQAAGLPVIASDIGGVSESVHGGLLVPPGDATALADALELWWKDPASLRAIGAAAQAHMQQHFSIDAMLRQVMETYREAIEHYGARQTHARR